MFQLNDGGRAEAGFQGRTGDCAVRAIAIATQKPYKEVYDALWAYNRGRRKLQDRHSPRNGGSKRSIREYMASIGWLWTPVMSIGSGCRVHLRADELPKGRLVVSCSRHLVAVIDGIVHDLYDPSRDGTRCVYGYWSNP